MGASLLRSLIGGAAVALVTMSGAAGCGDGRPVGDAGVAKTVAATIAPAAGSPTAPEKSAGATRDETRTVFELGPNALLAHRFIDETWTAEARSGHFDKYIPFDGGAWRMEQAGDQSVARLASKTGSLWIPERALAAQPNHLRMFVSSVARGSVVVRSGGARVATLELTGGWSEIEVELKAPLGRALRFETSPRTRFSIAALAVGRGELGPLAQDEPRDPIALSPKESLSFYLSPNPSSVLDGVASPKSCKVGARIASASGVGEWASLPFPVKRSGPIRLDVRLSDCDGGVLKSVALRTTKEPTADDLPLGPPPKNIILWVMDTLRADRIKPITPNARPEVPGFERLAARGVTFRRAWSAGNESKASHASMWTSVYPAVHNIRSAGRPGEWQLGGQLLTLGELMRAAGRRAVAVTANGMVTRNAGYNRGFERFENPMRDGPGKRRNGWIPSSRLYDRAIALVEPMLKDPVFLFLGTIDTHKPWIGHQPWLDRYDPGYRGKFQNAARPGQLGMKKGSMRCTVVPKPRDLQRINAIYDSAISYQDAHLAKMLDWLEEKGELDDTLIIVTADHGEELWEVGRCGHGASLRETLVNVPLLVSYPKRLPSGVVIEEGVDGVDILPTILELLDVQRPAFFQGASLVPLARAHGAGYPMASVASQYEYAHAMRIGDWKLRVGKGIELYDLASDPEEKTNRFGDAPIAEQQLSDALFLFLRNRKRWRKAIWGAANNLTREGALALEKP